MIADCKAASQGALACITDHLCVLDVGKLDSCAKSVFQNPSYHFDVVYFVIDGKLYSKRRRM